jgi:hypothetical protein
MYSQTDLLKQICSCSPAQPPVNFFELRVLAECKPFHTPRLEAIALCDGTFAKAAKNSPIARRNAP